jgi:hypothetical protein
MQRNISHQKSLEPFVYVALFSIYIGLSSIYLFLPPLFAILFIYFTKSIKKQDTIAMFLVSLCLVLYEAEKGYTLFSSIIYFVIVYKFIMPKLSQNSSCLLCIRISAVLLTYIGFFFFSLLLSSVFLLPEPAINYYVIIYIVIEFFIASIL